METDCFCRVRFKNKQQFELTLQLISFDVESPLFSCEVDEPLRETFNALEFISAPQTWRLDKDELVLCIHWFLPNSQEATDVINSLITSGVSSLSAFVFVDGQFCIGYVRDKEGTRTLTTWNGKLLSGMPENVNIFELLEEISQSLVPD